MAEQLNLEEIQNTIEEPKTAFDNLQKLEKDKGFHEAMKDKSNKQKLTFFNLGKDNNYNKLLQPKLIEEITNLYKSQIEKFNYE